MRMWGVNPELLCRNHLLGEHKELHMCIGSLRKGRSMDGHIVRGQMDTSLILSRHEELVIQMRERGFNHFSPIARQDVKLLEQLTHRGKLDIEENLRDLEHRCIECAKRIRKTTIGGVRNGI